MVENRLQEQLSKHKATDMSDCYGISTNLSIINSYLERLFNFIANDGTKFILIVNV